MASRRRTGKQKPPDREPVLRETWRRVIELLGKERLAIGGKPMGGRSASLVRDEAGVAGLVCSGYPSPGHTPIRQSGPYATVTCRSR
jgi:predicted alpha/beta-hydrolase family hydrolase